MSNDECNPFNARDQCMWSIDIFRKTGEWILVSQCGSLCGGNLFCFDWGTFGCDYKPWFDLSKDPWFKALNFIFERARPISFCNGHFQSHWKIFKRYFWGGTEAKTRGNRDHDLCGLRGIPLQACDFSDWFSEYVLLPCLSLYKGVRLEIEVGTKSNTFERVHLYQQLQKMFLFFWWVHLDFLLSNQCNQTEAGRRNSLVPFCTMNINLHYWSWMQGAWPRWWQYDNKRSTAEHVFQ